MRYPEQHTNIKSPNSWEGIPEDCALGDNFLQFGTLIGMGIRFSKTTANMVAYPPGGRYAQNPIWPPPEQ